MSDRNSICSINWGAFTPTEIRKLSVCEITNATQGGSSSGAHSSKASQKGSPGDANSTPYDHRMGVLECGMCCDTCGKDNKHCVGHIGHIELPIPVYNIIFMDVILKILQCVCSVCARSRIKPQHLKLMKIYGSGAPKLRNIATKVSKLMTCPWEDCGKPLFTFTSPDGETIYKSIRDSKPIIFGAGETLNIFSRISNETCALLGFNVNLPKHPEYTAKSNLTFQKEHVLQMRPEAFVFTAFPVIPPKARPYIIQDGKQCDDDLTDMYNVLLKLCKKIRQTRAKLATCHDVKLEMNLRTFELDMRQKVWTIIHNKKEHSKVSSSGRAHKGLYERVTSKTGVVQHNLRGKRADFTARTVITGGGTMIRADEIGIPRHIAEILTVPEYINSRNISHYQNLVHEGKVLRIIRGGVIRNLAAMPDKGRKMRLMIKDKVEIHLPEGEPILINRQPTLRPESIMALKTKIIDSDTMKLPESMTRAYNADFDGDEMNIHVVQSKAARIEVAVLCRAAAHLITPQKNGPINGIVQDGLVAGYLLTNIWKDTNDCNYVSTKGFTWCLEKSFIGTERIHNFLRRAEKYYPSFINSKTNPPSFKKDNVPGSLLASVVFPDGFTFKKTTHTNSNFPKVRIIDGIIIPNTGPYKKKASGPICKKVIGSHGGSAVHELYKYYSPEVAINFLSECQFVFCHWITINGFSMSVSDCVVNVEDEIASVLAQSQAKINMILERCGDNPPDEYQEKEINATLNSTVNVGLTLAKNNMNKHDRNALNIMRESGAKGNLTNIVQITAFVGQQNISGKRVVPGTTNYTRTLPYFKVNDHSAPARGFVSSGYYRGLNPTEVFFHAMGGRQGIISTAIKTSETGYIQKKLARKMEDHKPRNDCTVRGTGDKIVQYVYGGDGLDAKKLVYAKGVNFPFFCNPVSVARKLNAVYLKNNPPTPKSKKNVKNVPRKLQDDEIELIASFITAGYHNFTNLPTTLVRVTENARSILKKCLKFAVLYEEVIPDFCKEIQDMYESSKIQVGCSVGMIAACSIGEPTTQLTLNTFHLAGTGRDVSIGVPRLNELMSTSKPEKQKKPSGTFYFNDDKLRDYTEQLKELRNKPETPELSQTLKTLTAKRMEYAHNLKATYQEICVSDMLKTYKFLYVAEQIFERKHFPYVTGEIYDQYNPKWWKTFNDINSPDDYLTNPMFWVMKLHLDLQKMYDYRFGLRLIANAIESECPEVRCLCSPDVDSEIDVYINFEHITGLMKGSKLFQTFKNDRSFITEHNLEFYICRDIIQPAILSVCVSGIPGIGDSFVREDMSTGEICVDANFKQRTAIVSKKRFIALLSDELIDYTRTIVDDMRTIQAVLGMEATIRFLNEEITRVISYDGTYVNPRHIQLLVDSMTYTGEITSVRRDGIPRDVGPIAKIMFEQSIANAVTSASYTETDKHESIASSIFTGNYKNFGTGMVELESNDN